MRIHIPKHFENLGVMRILKSLVEAYIKEVGTSDLVETNYKDYLKASSVDPVKRLLDYICKIEKINLGEENEESDEAYETRKAYILSYYSHYLYSLRGTIKIFDILKEMESVLDLKIGTYNYSTTNLYVEIDTIEIDDISLFNKYLSAFFGSLLYYKDLKEIIDNIRLNLEFEINSNISGGASFVSEYTVEEYEN